MLINLVPGENLLFKKLNKEKILLSVVATTSHKD